MSFLDNENYGREINLQVRLRFLRDLLKGIYSHSEVRKDKICPLVREIKILLTTDGKLWRNALYVVSCIIKSFHLETFYGFCLAGCLLSLYCLICIYSVYMYVYI